MENYIDGNTKLCGLIGNPVKHTFSPFIHNKLADMLGINLVYVPFEVATGTLADAIKGATALDVLGLNVTIPYKNDVIPYLEDIDPLAKGVGAVNTLVRGKNGYKGYNTDMTGLYRFLQEEGVNIEGKTVVILGAGGVSRPTAFLCGAKGAKKVFILNRTFEKALEVADEVNKALSEFSNDDKFTADGLSARGENVDYPNVVIPMKLEDYRNLYEEKDNFLVFQCTSVGLFPDVNSAVVEDKEFYEHIDAAMDMIYRPIETKFMKLAREAGADAFSGLKMLLYQGIDAFELWNNVKITKEQAEEVYYTLMLEVTGARNIILEGFMGSGKSTVAEKLSYLLEMEYMDTDKEIEDIQERTINEIFEEEGEDAFRDMETDLLEYAVSERFRYLVISLGGGLPLREKNRELLKKIGKVVYLRTKPETVYERLKNDDKRPLLRGENPKDKIEKLLAERAERYEAAADIIIDTDELNPGEIARKIITELGLDYGSNE